MDETKKKITEPDDFWDLSDLVPKRKSPPREPVEHSTDGVEIGVFRRQDHGGKVYEDVPLTERSVLPPVTVKPQTPEVTYTPEGSLLREVRIYPWKTEYTYYEQFRRHAVQLVDREGKSCPEVDFFSYMPQYTQMNREQLAYYLWWRTNFRNGTCLPAAYSYLLLYLYELINLDETQLSPQTGCENMVRLWLSYREKHPRLDALVREWLCDFCLLHRISPPRLDPNLYRTLLSGCRLKEFYVAAGEHGSALTTALLLFCNNYDYTKSKFYREETKADYDRVLGGAIAETVDFLRETSGKHLTDTTGVSTVTRDTFAGAICSVRFKRRIEVDYTSFSHTHELRYIMTDVLKYAENALRHNRGIKSRLSIYAVSVPLRQRLDAYLAKALPPRQTKAAQKAEIPDYERRYDLPVTAVSLENAAAIEAESWQTTKRLVEAFTEPMDTITLKTVRENGNFAPLATSREGASAPPANETSAVSSVPPVPPAAPALGGAPAAFGGASRPSPLGPPAAEGPTPRAVTARFETSTPPAHSHATTAAFEAFAPPRTIAAGSDPTASAAGGTDTPIPPSKEEPYRTTASIPDGAFTPKTVRENEGSGENTASTDSVAVSPFAAAIGDLAAFLPLARDGNRAAQREFARQKGLMVDAIADKINTVAGDILGDIVLEQEGDTYVILEDYLDFLTDQGVL